MVFERPPAFQIQPKVNVEPTLIICCWFNDNLQRCYDVDISTSTGLSNPTEIQRLFTYCMDMAYNQGPHCLR